jgi:hypothetical protein
VISNTARPAKPQYLIACGGGYKVSHTFAFVLLVVAWCLAILVVFWFGRRL